MMSRQKSDSGLLSSGDPFSLRFKGPIPSVNELRSLSNHLTSIRDSILQSYQEIAPPCAPPTPVPSVSTPSSQHLPITGPSAQSIPGVKRGTGKRGRPKGSGRGGMGRGDTLANSPLRNSVLASNNETKDFLQSTDSTSIYNEAKLKPTIEISQRKSYDVAGVKRKREDDEDSPFKIPPLPSSLSATSEDQNSIIRVDAQSNELLDRHTFADPSVDSERPSKVWIVEEGDVNGTTSGTLVAVAPGSTLEGAEKKEEIKKFKVRLNLPKLDPLSTLQFPSSLPQFTFAPPPPLIPPPPRSIPAMPYPSSQSKVNFDFTAIGHKPSQGSQVPFSSFASNVELYLRPFGEDDLGLLSPTSPSQYIESFSIPPRGEHYAKLWNISDGLPTDAGLPGVKRGLMRREFMNDRAFGEERGMEKWGERALAALVGDGKAGLESLRRDKTNPASNSGEKIPGSPKKSVRFGKEPVNEMSDKNVEAELSVLGLLDEDSILADGEKGDDDEISTALRLAQDALRKQTELNELRKAVLFKRVKDRMAYQDYLTLLDGCDTVVEAAYRARMRQIKRERAPKDKEEKRGTRLSRRDEEDRTTSILNEEAIIASLQHRREVIDSLGPLFTQKEGEGRWRGIPQESIYKGVKGLEDDAMMAT